MVYLVIQKYQYIQHRDIQYYLENLSGETNINCIALSESTFGENNLGAFLEIILVVFQCH